MSLSDKKQLSDAADYAAMIMNAQVKFYRASRLPGTEPHIETLTAYAYGVWDATTELLKMTSDDVMPMPYAIMVGDSYSVVAGCDKIFSTCAGRFDNAVNFRGEPHVPGTDRILETSATRSR